MSKMYKNHYDCSKLVNSLDKNNQKPAFYIVCSKERGPGKTYSFSRLLTETFLESGKKFILLTRNQGELGNIAAGILDGYLIDQHPEITVSEKIQMKGVFSQIFFSRKNGENVENMECGYVIPIRAVDKIKKISSLFYDSWCFYFDEFQPMNSSTYLKDEVGLLLNIYKSIARGEGSATRYMPIFMASNTITLGNPYFSALGLNRYIQKNTKFFRGDGVVFERCEVEGLSEQHSKTPIERALTNYLQINKDNTWINDNDSLVCNPENWGRGLCISVLHYDKQTFGLYSYFGVGLTYITRKYDQTCQYHYNLILDGDLNRPLITTSNIFIKLKKDFYRGLVRVSDSGIQNILLDIFS